MPGRQAGPHDSLFRWTFSSPENAASELRAVLPPGLTGRLDLDRLIPVPGTFVDEDLRQRHTDVLYTAPLDGRDAYLSVLMEHQSTSDPLMAYRMARYMMKIWDRYLREHPGARRLPAVIPLVVYTGKSRWSAPVRLQDLIDLVPVGGEEAADYMPRFSFLLDDLSAVDPAELRARDVTVEVRVSMLSFVHVPGNARLHEAPQDWRDDLRALVDEPDGDLKLAAQMAYIMRKGETPASDLASLFASLGPDAEKVYMTTADMLKASEEARAILRNLKNRGVSVDEHSRDRIASCLDAETLDTWLDRSVEITEIAELF